MHSPDLNSLDLLSQTKFIQRGFHTDDAAVAETENRRQSLAIFFEEGIYALVHRCDIFINLDCNYTEK